MSYRRKLFKFRKPYKLDKSNQLFYKAMKENLEYQYKHCKEYRRILDSKGFTPKDFKCYEDIAKIPFLPTLYFKHHELISMSKKRMLIKATSSGTSGKKSLIGFNLKSLLRGLSMVIRVGRYHHLWSLKPVHYVIFGYEPSRKNKTAISKTAFGFTFFAPALSRTYALRYKKNGYELDMENMKRKLMKYAKAKCPVRTIGFPAYTYFLLKQMQEEGIHIKLPKGSLITLGGGWKQFYAEKIEKEDFYKLVYDVLGVDDKHVIEFFGAVEHPILYTDCRYHHFHVPAYGRVIIRDVKTLEPVPNGQIGLINLLTPMVDSVPILSIMTDDLGILHDEPCPCGEPSPYLEIIGRVGIKDIVTCAAGAEELLKGK
ncbi:MAG: hypothetical protein K2O23_02220 [Anaeroplasmataceae bacterium]|nr:hypothetical protein [Anaeroplasmataceae bacterium]